MCECQQFAQPAMGRMQHGGLIFTRYPKEHRLHKPNDNATDHLCCTNQSHCVLPNLNMSHSDQQTYNTQLLQPKHTRQTPNPMQSVKRVYPRKSCNRQHWLSIDTIMPHLHSSSHEQPPPLRSQYDSHSSDSKMCGTVIPQHTKSSSASLWTASNPLHVLCAGHGSHDVLLRAPRASSGSYAINPGHPLGRLQHMALRHAAIIAIALS